MAPRAYWKGYLRLSLVSCPAQLFPAISEREKIRFHQINRKTGNRIKYCKLDAVTGKPVSDEDIIKGYEVGKGRYIEIAGDELESVAIGSTHTIEIDQFVPRSEIDELYWNIPYYIAPDGEVGGQAFAVIREAIRKEGMVALGHMSCSQRGNTWSRSNRAARACWASPSAIPTRSARKQIISMIFRMKKFPRICSIWQSISSRPSPGISSQKNSRITTRTRSGS